MSVELQRRTASFAVPALITEAGDRAGRHFVAFFTTQIRNKNTRAAYAQAVSQFLRWCEERRLKLLTTQPVAVAAYVEELAERRATPTVKQPLAAIKMLLERPTDRLCNHSFRTTGITALIAGGGTVDKASPMAAHASTKTTKLYNRTGDEITLDEVERIAI